MRALSSASFHRLGAVFEVAGVVADKAETADKAVHAQFAQVHQTRIHAVDSHMLGAEHGGEVDREQRERHFALRIGSNRHEIAHSWKFVRNRNRRVRKRGAEDDAAAFNHQWADKQREQSGAQEVDLHQLFIAVGRDFAAVADVVGIVHQHSHRAVECLDLVGKTSHAGKRAKVEVHTGDVFIACADCQFLSLGIALFGVEASHHNGVAGFC